MSNTSSVTPYVAAAVIVPVVVAAATARWLLETTGEDRAALAQARDAARQDRIAVERRREAEKLPLLTATLHLRDHDDLVATARSIGYTVDRLGGGAEPTRLRDAAGERLLISQDAAGRLVVGARGDAGRIHAVVRAHTVRKAVAHLAASGMTVKAAETSSGEVQLLAQEATPGTGGAAEVRAQVHADGTTTVDVDRLRGGRCTQIVQELALATGGVVDETVLKPAAFQLPGEPARARVRCVS